MNRMVRGLLACGIAVCSGCHPNRPAAPAVKAVAPVISLSVGPADNGCAPEGTLVVAIHNPGSRGLWIRIAWDEEQDPWRRFWLDVVAQDGHAVHSRCISSSHTTPYEVLGPGATTKFEAELGCYRQKVAGWYLVTVHYQDDPPPVVWPPGEEIAHPRVTSALMGPDAPPGTSKVRSRVDSNGQWIFLNAMDAAECKRD